MKFLISYEKGKNGTYAIHFDKGRQMFYINGLTVDDLHKLYELVGKVLFNSIKQSEKQEEEKPIDYNEELKKCRENPLYFFDKYMYVKLKKQKSTWSEEDEQIMLSIEQVMNCASLLNLVPEKIDKIKSWLKTLKQRIEG